MASYFSKYQGRGGPAIAPGIVQMMGSIGDEYAKGITALGEGVAEYQKNKAEKGRAEADFENALSRMDSLYGEEPGDYQQVLNAVDSKTMEKIQKGKGTKEDFLSALNSLNTVGESIEDRREDVESARRFDETTDQRERQIKATERIAKGGWAHAASEGGANRAARKAEGDASRTHSAAEGKADRGSREGMHQAGITASNTEGKLNRESAEKQQNRQITSTEFMFGEKQKQEWAKHSDHLNLSQDQLDQTWNIHVEDMSEKVREFNDTLAQKDRHHDAVLTETKRVNQVTVDKFRQEGDRAKAGQVALGTYIDKTQTEFDPDAHSAAMMGVGSLSGPTPDQLQSYMDNPEQFQRQMTNSERAVKALQTPGISPEVQDSIAKMANTDAGTGGVKFVKHPKTGEYVMAVGPRGSISQLPPSGKSGTEIRVDYERERDRIKSIENKQDALVEAKKSKLASLQKIIAGGIYDATDEEYKKADADWEDLITELGGGEKIPEYDIRGKLKN